MDVIQKVNYMNNVFIDLLKNKTLNEICDSIKTQKTLPNFVFSGVGKNWYICEKVVKTWLSMGLHAQALDCTHALHGDLGMLQANEYPSNDKTVLFYLSKSGTTVEMLKLVNIVNHLKADGMMKHVTTVGFFLNNELPDPALYDHLIVPSAEFKPEMMYEFDERNLVPSLSINVMQMVLDYLGVAIYESSPSLVEAYKYNHLAGANGKKLGGDIYMEQKNN